LHAPAETRPRAGATVIAAQLAGLRSAIAFLTILPLPLDGSREDGGWHEAPGWFALVGAAIGAVAGGVRLAGLSTFGGALASALGIAAMLVLTGALHLDGLADVADGLGARGDRDRRLAVMRDSANGTFATAAVAVWLLLTVAALAPLGGGHALRALLAAAAVGRAGALGHAKLTKPARRDGLGSGFTPSSGQLGFAALTGLAACLLALGIRNGAIVAAVAAAVTGVGALLARRLIGGQTGDTLGATVVGVELAVLLTVRALG
jgi:adenosylcobinamide-GDP ribazoletransferase